MRTSALLAAVLVADRAATACCWLWQVSSDGSKSHVCKPPAEALARSYPAPARFPFPAYRLVLETTPGTCNLYGSPRVCRDFSSGDHFEPEFHVREAISSHLIHCLNDDRKKTCNTLDIGMSTGYFTAMMLALGANVTSVERQTDMLSAFADTARVNCWSHRWHGINALIGYDVPAGATFKDTGRDMGRPLSHGYGDKHQASEIPVVDVKALLSGRHFDFIKMDIDSIEMRLMGQIEEMLRAGRTHIHAIVTEANFANVDRDRRREYLVALFGRMAALGYDIYILDVHTLGAFGGVRLYDPRGMEIGAPREWHPPAGIEEYSHVRFFRHLMKFVNPADPQSVLGVLESATKQGLSGRGGQQWAADATNLLFTKESLIEPYGPASRMHPGDFKELKRRDWYNLPDNMEYKYPSCGMNPANATNVPCKPNS